MTYQQLPAAAKLIGKRPAAAGLGHRHRALLGDEFVALQIAPRGAVPQLHRAEVQWTPGGAASLNQALFQLRGQLHQRLWFTKLPPDASGTFQASIYSIQLKGRP